MEELGGGPLRLPWLLSTAVFPGDVWDPARRCCHMAFHQCAERVTDAWAARWVHGFPGPLGLPDIRDTGKWRGHQGRMAGSLAASLTLPPRTSSICHTACAAREVGVVCSGEADRPDLHPLSLSPTYPAPQVSRDKSSDGADP